MSSLSQTDLLKLDLAARLAPPFGDISKKILHQVWVKVMKGAEKVLEKKYDPFFQQRLWKEISPKMLEKFDLYYLHVIRCLILLQFDHDQVSEMVREHQEFGSVINKEYRKILQKSFRQFATQMDVELNKGAITILRDSLLKESQESSSSAVAS